ncbi:MAG: hypothetical protein ACLUD0_05825 [Eubacterium ramulus]
MSHKRDTSILDGLVSVKIHWHRFAQDFVPTIETVLPPAFHVAEQSGQAVSTTELQGRSLAGGYVGHNEGGHIWVIIQKK